MICHVVMSARGHPSRKGGALLQGGHLEGFLQRVNHLLMGLLVGTLHRAQLGRAHTCAWRQTRGRGSMVNIRCEAMAGSRGAGLKGEGPRCGRIKGEGSRCGRIKGEGSRCGRGQS